MNQLPLNKNELLLIREMLTKYKQGYISGLIPGSNITFSPSGCRNKIVSSTGSGGGGGSSYIPPYLKTGGASWSGTGLVYDVTALEYYFNGDKNTSATQVTLDASDPDDNRLDAIVVDEAGVVSVIKGDASASPISPSVDESHILVQYILVEAGTTQKMQIALTDRSNNIVASTIVHEFIVLENFEITSSPFISLVTAPTGANFILQIQKNGVEVGINTKALVVTAGTNVSTATTDFNGVTFAKGDRISFRVTQIGSVNAGKGLDILLNFKN